jgi:Alginate export
MQLFQPIHWLLLKLWAVFDSLLSDTTICFLASVTISESLLSIGERHEKSILADDSLLMRHGGEAGCRAQRWRTVLTYFSTVRKKFHGRNTAMRRLKRFLVASTLSLFAINQFASADEPISVTLNRQPAPVVTSDLSDSVAEADLYVAADATAAPPAEATPPVDAEKAAAEAKKKAAAEKKKKADLKKAVATAYAPVFYNNKFDYLNNPAYCDWHIGENLKRKKINDCVTMDLGGQYRARLHNERNHRGLGLTGVDDDFLLHRTRLYSNVQIGNNIRFFGEYIDAESNYENFAPRGIEVNRSDMQNLFVDAKLTDCIGSGDTSVRLGRQELIFGNQRLVSPLDWANTRRTFEGIDMFYRSQDWAIDAFLTRPVIVDPHNFDSPSYDQSFDGVYASYKGIKDQTIETYYMYYSNEVLGTVAGTNGIHFNTLGARWQGSKDKLLWEFEGAYQFGDNDNGSDHSAGFWVAGLGKKFDHDWKPTAWLFYDFATGGGQTGQRQGFDHLFPLGHKYHGFMDLFARSNIQTPNILVEAQPHEKIKLLAWWHYFYLQDGADSPYNVNMSAFNGANAPASRDLGHEIDLTFTYLISPRSDILFGYSHFFAGDYYDLTPGVPYRDDADFFYTQFQVNF